MIEITLLATTWTSAGGANPVDNIVKVLGEQDHPELENEIRAIVAEEIEFAEIEAIKAPDTLTGGETVDPALKKEINSLQETLNNLKESPFGTLSTLTREQVSNLQGFSKDPFQFIFTKFFKKFAKGAGIVALASIIFSAVQLIIAELMKPGRALDRRFRRVARDEILLFNSLEEQAQLRQGFRTVTVTTIPFLKGSQLRGQISGNLYNPTAIPMNRIDPRRVIAPIVSRQIASRGSKFFNRRN